MSPTSPRALALFVALALTACGPQRASSPDGALQDASIIVVDPDSGSADAGVPPGPDAAVTADTGLEPTADSGEPDAASLPGPDAGDPDAGLEVVDAGPADAAAEPGDADIPDAGAANDPDAAMPDDAGLPPGGDASVVVRIMAANLTSGNMQSYDPGEGLRLIQGVHPDIVLIQEFNYGNNSDPVILQMVQTTLGAEFTYCRQNSGVQIPNGVISRWPIVSCGTWTDPEVGNRGFTWARIDVPGQRDLWAISVHLLTSSASTRNLEAKALVQDIQTNVPTGDLLTLGGDFNTDTMTEACYTTFAPELISSGPQPVDQHGVPGTNASRSKPYDHVLADADLHALRVPTVIGSNSFPNGLVLDSTDYTPLSDIAPVQFGDSAAPSMQHMGVVRDFLISY
jgi:endonuclease/exonuclease/phosphatase family metal-dependent hydrolase